MSSATQANNNRFLLLADPSEHSSSASEGSASPQASNEHSGFCSCAGSPAFDPLPPPRDLYSRRDIVIASMKQLRILYSELRTLEATLPDNVVQDLRAEMDIVWVRMSDHKKALEDDRNLQTIGELRKQLHEREAEICQLRERLNMVSRAMHQGSGIPSSKYDKRDVRYSAPVRPKEKEQSRARAEYLLGKDVKSWR